MILEKAHGKINLTLDVLARRPDGYHQVKMVMQQIELHDLVSLSLRDDEQIVITSNMAGVPLDEKNLAYRAALVMKKEFGLTAGVNIHLDKHLPMEAGLAGGSSNGAAVLKGLNRLFNLECSVQQLMKLAIQLGADTPFCVLGGTALATGIGEELSLLENRLTLSLILVKPPFGAATKEIYQNLKLNQVSSRPDADKMIKALTNGNETEAIQAMGNVLEEVTKKLYPEIQQIKDELKELGIPGLMSGSGTTVFGIIPSGKQELAEQAARFFKKKLGYGVFLTNTI